MFFILLGITESIFILCFSFIVSENFLYIHIFLPYVTMHELWHHIAECTQEEEARKFVREMLKRKA
jgi:hypothetical protein